MNNQYRLAEITVKEPPQGSTNYITRKVFHFPFR